MGIIAACAPTLRPGWRWLYRKIKGRDSGKGHTLLTDEVQLQPYRRGVPTTVATVTSNNNNHTTDLEPGNSFETPLPVIQKTTQVDVNVTNTVAGSKVPAVTGFQRQI